MAYNKTVWVNNEEPSIDADNLNKMEQGIYDAQYPDGGTSGQLLAKTVNGKAWVDAPNSAVWGLIQGTLSDQTDLQAALDDVGNVDTVNGIQPDTNKNVQVDVELTQAEYDALPSSKLTDDVNYYIKDGTNIPQASVISASGVQYSNSSSGLSATNVQSAIDALNDGLTKYVRGTIILDSIAAGATSNTVVNITVPSGYSAIGVMLYTDGNNAFPVWAAGVSNTSFRLMYANNRTSATTMSVWYTVVCIKA